jgi:multiple sugar transport system substrate-binding protein
MEKLKLLIPVIFLLLKTAFSETITLRMIGPEDIGNAWHTIIKQFEKENPNIKIKYISGPWSTDERQNMYIRSFLGKEPVEIVYMDVTWTAKFAKNGWLMPLDKWFVKDLEKEFLPSTINAGRFNGKLYRIPVRADVGVIYYRKDLIKKPPETWEQFENICSKIPKNMYCISFQGMQYEGLVCNFFEYFWGAGGTFFKNGKLNINSKPTVEALRFMKGLIEKGYAPKSVITFQEQHSLNFFMEEKSVFMRNWPYAWNILNREGSKLKGKVGIAPVFHKEGYKSHGTLGGWGLGIAKGVKNIEAVWKFIKFATSEESQRILHFKRGAVPSRKKLFFDKEILKESPHYKELYKILLNAKPRPVHPEYPKISDTLQKHTSAVLVGIETPEKATEIMYKTISGILKGENENYLKRIFYDYTLWRTSVNTLYFTLISVPIEFLLGLAIALLINLKIRGRNTARLAVLIPWALPTAVMAMSWQWMFNNPFGVINDVLIKIGVLNQPFDWLSSPEGAMFASIFADVWKTTPFVVIILLSGLQSIPKELLESISIDGAKSFSRFWNVTFPLLLPFVRVALIFRLIHAAGIFDLIWVLTKGGPADSTKTIAIYIYDLAFRYDGIGYAIFLTVIFLAVLVLFTILIIKITTLKYEKIK